MDWCPTKAKRVSDVGLAASFVALVSAVSSISGCCNDVDQTECFNWEESTTCPSPDVAKEKMPNSSTIVNSSGTFWPAHEYLIYGLRKIEPAECCYEVTVTVCTKELH